MRPKLCKRSRVQGQSTEDGDKQVAGETLHLLAKKNKKQLPCNLAEQFQTGKGFKQRDGNEGCVATLRVRRAPKGGFPTTCDRHRTTSQPPCPQGFLPCPSHPSWRTHQISFKLQTGGGD